MTAAAVADDLVAAEADRDPEKGINRDQYGRPLIVPPGGKGRVAYTRVSTMAKLLDDQTALEKWRQRRLIAGMTRQPWHLTAAADYATDPDAPESRAELGRIANEALKAGGIDQASAVGTAIHNHLYRLDLGMEVGEIGAAYAADVRAYQAAMRGLRAKIVAAERFVVLDEIRVAGSFDRILEIDGTRYIADLKTGKSVTDYGQSSIAAQLAFYAHGMFYDPATGERTPLPGVNGERGICVHLPAGKGRCALHWVKIREAWERAVPLIAGAREWRSRKDLFSPLTVEAAEDNLADGGLIGDPITARILAANSVEELTAIWAEFAQTGWKPEHTQQAAARKAALTEGATA